MARCTLGVTKHNRTVYAENIKRISKKVGLSAGRSKPNREDAHCIQTPDGRTRLRDVA